MWLVSYNAFSLLVIVSVCSFWMKMELFPLAFSPPPPSPPPPPPAADSPCVRSDQESCEHRSESAHDIWTPRSFSARGSQRGSSHMIVCFDDFYIGFIASCFLLFLNLILQGTPLLLLQCLLLLDINSTREEPGAQRKKTWAWVRNKLLSCCWTSLGSASSSVK